MEGVPWVTQREAKDGEVHKKESGHENDKHINDIVDNEGDDNNQDAKMSWAAAAAAECWLLWRPV